MANKLKPITKNPEIEKIRNSISYDKNPPLCKNCRNFRDINKKVTEVLNLPYCKYNRISVKPFAICNTWIGKDGSSLEL
jgi:predicted Zn-ribbon and HTH transcriptional regulator